MLLLSKYNWFLIQLHDTELSIYKCILTFYKNLGRQKSYIKRAVGISKQTKSK